jgi:hypothetical protein
MPSMGGLKPTWTTASFLLYAGGLAVLAAAVRALEFLSSRYPAAGFVGWAGLVFAGLALFTIGFHGLGRWMAAGVFGFAAVIGFGVLLGALERWFGWIPSSTPSAFAGTHPGLLALTAATGFAAFVALTVLRFPLLGAIVVGLGWYFVTDLVSNGGTFSAVISLLFGAGLVFLGFVVDRLRWPVGFWLHVGAGLTIGGALLFFWHDGALDWVLVALAGLAYIVMSVPLGRSSYAVLGAVGLALSAAYFVSRWAGTSVTDVLGVTHHGHPWVSPLVVALFGFVLVALGLLLERGRRAGVGPPAPVDDLHNAS